MIFEKLCVELTAPAKIYCCEPQWVWTPPPLQDSDFWLVLKGEGKVVVDEKSFSLTPGAAFIFPPDATIQAKHNPENPLTVFAVHFLCDTLQAFAAKEITDLPFFALLANRCVQYSTCREDLSATMIATFMITMALKSKKSSNPPANANIFNLGIDIQANPAFDWNVPAMAQRLNLSRSNFFRQFSRVFQMPPMKYVVQSRIKRAQTLLTETVLSVTEISEALGYSDLYYFSRQFKTETGLSPSQFRRQQKTGAARLPLFTAEKQIIGVFTSLD